MALEFPSVLCSYGDHHVAQATETVKFAFLAALGKDDLLQ